MLSRLKLSIITAVLVALIVFVSVYLSMGKQSLLVSHQFVGTVAGLEEGNLIVIGDYVLEGEKVDVLNNLGSIRVKVSLNSASIITRTTLQLNGFSLNPPTNQGESKENVSGAQFVQDVSRYNSVILIRAEENIYSLSEFTASSIEYKILK